MIVRAVRPSEYARLGDVTAAAYAGIGAFAVEPSYEDEVRDIAAKVEAGALVMVAVADDDRVVGGVCYVPDIGNPFFEFDDPDAASFRHLAVDPSVQGTGAGRALVEWCIDQARRDGKKRILIHSTPLMPRAHALYTRAGFVRREDLDLLPVPHVALLGFSLDL